MPSHPKSLVILKPKFGFVQNDDFKNPWDCQNAIALRPTERPLRLYDSDETKPAVELSPHVTTATLKTQPLDRPVSAKPSSTVYYECYSETFDLSDSGHCLDSSEG